MYRLHCTRCNLVREKRIAQKGAPSSNVYRIDSQVDVAAACLSTVIREWRYLYCTQTIRSDLLRSLLLDKSDNRPIHRTTLLAMSRGKYGYVCSMTRKGSYTTCTALEYRSRVVMRQSEKERVPGRKGERPTFRDLVSLLHPCQEPGSGTSRMKTTLRSMPERIALRCQTLEQFVTVRGANSVQRSCSSHVLRED